MATRTWIGATSSAWGTAGNWLEASVPVNGDDVVFTNNNVDVTGSDQSAVTLASLTQDQSYTGKIGTATTFLKIGVSGNVTLGAQSPSGVGNGSGRLNLDLAATTPTVTVISSSSIATDIGQDPIRLQTGGTIATMNVTGGNLSLANAAGSSMTITTLTVAGGNIYIGAGVALTTLKQSAGIVENHSTSTITTVTVNGGNYVARGTGAHTTIKANAGITAYNGTGTITTLQGAGNIDFTGDLRAKTVTTTNLYAGASLHSHSGITFTNGININQADLDRVSIRLGGNVGLAVSYL